MIDKIENIVSKNVGDMNDEEVENIVKWLKENFSRKEAFHQLLGRNPQTILILRVLLNLTRQSFSRSLSINLESLEKVEKGVRVKKKVVDAWSEKLFSLFNSIQVDWDFERFKRRWREKKKKRFEDFDTQLFEKLKGEFIKLNLPTDLRKCNEEEFLKVLTWLKEKIEEVGICEELLKVEPQLLLILRISLGLSQKEFALRIGKTFRWVKDIDSKRRFLEDPQTIGRVIEGLSNLSLNEIEEEVALATWIRFKIATRDSMRELAKKSLMEFEKEDIEKLFELVKERTNNFTEIPLELLMEMPSSVLIFRLGIGMGVKRFSTLIQINERWLRKIESSQGGMSLRNAIKMKEILENFLKERKIEKETVVKNFIRFKNFIASPVNNLTGIKLAENAPPTEEEKRIIEIFRKAGIEFNLHSTLQLPNGKLVNVDFLVKRNGETFVIEVFKLKKMGRIATLRISEIDHRFRGLKINNPNIKTILIVSSKDEELSKILAEKAKFESFDTDFVFTLAEINKLLEVIT